jgi:cytochrome c oxidase accessory protein FixG
LTVTGKFSFVHPADVRGRFDRVRQVGFAALILVYLLLPWLRVGGQQAVLLDIGHRRFQLFGLTLWAHEAPLLFLLLAGAAFALCFLTAVWGRVWCGYACPQTVFIAFVFRRIEGWIEGNHLERMRLDGRRFQGDWVLKKAAKWAAFTAVAMVLSHSFLAYFVGTDRLKMAVFQAPRENWTLFLAMASIAAFVLVDFGWVRERLCFTLCPYGRIQTVLMDRHSLAVVYDARRGEPRRGLSAEAAGDCVACDRCVQVCPTGIDIRHGVQMECIACTACIDACDDVMGRLGKPPGLVRYDTEAGLEGEPSRFSRPRPLLYLGFVGVLWGGLAAILGTRREVDIVALRAGGAPYQEVQDSLAGPLVINHMRFDLTNVSAEDLVLRMDCSAPFRAQGFEVVTAANPLPLARGKAARVEVFIKFPKARLDFGKARTELEFRAGDRLLGREELTMVGPYQ